MATSGVSDLDGVSSGEEVVAVSKPTKGVKPGQQAPKSGQYKQPGKSTEVTAVQGKPMPPGAPGKKWVLVDPTKHKK